MSTRYESISQDLVAAPLKWLVTGCAGFIGSNLLETLLKLGQTVTGLDNFATGHQRNLDEVRASVSPEQWARFTFIEGDIRDLAACQRAVQGVDFVLHQAALGSVPRSLKDPITTNDVNVGGFLNVLVAARDAQVKSFVYAASSSTYGDHPALPKVEEYRQSAVAVRRDQVCQRTLCGRVRALVWFRDGRPALFQRLRQAPGSGWRLRRRDPEVDRGHDQGRRCGNQRRRRDQPGLLLRRQRRAGQPAGRDGAARGRNQVYNVAVSGRSTLNDLFGFLVQALGRQGVAYAKPAKYGEFRAGDVRHSQADVSKAGRLLGYQPTHTVLQGLDEAMPWYTQFLR